MLTRKGQDLLCLVALMAILAVSSSVAMLPIKISQQPVAPVLNPSPLGYTYSLALFLVPCVVLGIWVLRSKYTREQRRACGFTLGLLIPIGAILDLFFGRMFLLFPNLKATMGILAPGYDLRSGWAGLWGPGWQKFLPLEEFAFYLLGFIAILLTYVWADEVLFKANKVDDRQRTPRVFRGWIARSLFWLVAGAALFAGSLVIRTNTPSQTGHAFPGYFLFLLIASILPSMVCSRIAFQFINWRALSVSWMFILIISQFWEASLGIPYGWWAYQPDQMMGLFLKAHCDLPIEALLVWTLGTWTTVIIYETILTGLYAGRKGRGLFGVINAEESELQDVKNHHNKTPVL